MKKYFLSTVSGVVILSVLGNALWENLFKPISNFFLIFCVNIATLGIRDFQNNIYKDIARGLHEDISLRIMLIVYSFIVALLFIASILYYLKNKYQNKEKLKETKFYSVLNTVFDNRFFIIIYLTVSSVFLVLDLSRTIYINQAVTYYNQLKMIVSPIITDDESKMVDSNFAQISNADDYIEVTEELENVAIVNKKILPNKPSVLTAFKYQIF